ncbi:MAG: pantoate--beta-alanine ligase [Planctomycetota bacterium]
MKIAKTIADVRPAVAAARREGQTIGLVPTMGALHEGHLSLIDAAADGCDYVVVSNFVNPTQFGPNEDLETYPRTPDADRAACQVRGVDVVFEPPVEEMYPREELTTVQVRDLSDRLCGARRPGHFTGVCTVVSKLLHIVLPDRAYFGEKDYQQAVIIRRTVEDLNFPVEIVTCPTVRETDGLARSSRNAYLTAEERQQAPALHESLQLARGMIEDRHPPAGEVLDAMREHLAACAPDGREDYIEIVDPETLESVEDTDRTVVIAMAVYLGSARLIDNMRIG